MGGDFFGFFLDLLVVVPVLLAVRIVSPQPVVFRIAAFLAGVYLLYGQAPRLLPFIVAFWIVVWLLQHLASRAESWPEGTKEKAALAVVVLVPLVPMAAWKIAPQLFVPLLNEWSAKLLWTAAPGLGFADALVGLVVPLGLSFATFRAIDLLLKNYLGLLTPISLDRVLYYGFFPPILALGPISEYEEVRYDRELPRLPNAGDIAVGIFRVMFGIIAIFAIAMPLERAAAALWDSGQASIIATWCALILYGLFFYVNFSGYSSVAIGAARILSVKLKENFANPYLKTNPQAFWNAWHMSLTRWAQRYVFVPLGGMRPERQYFAIFAVIMTIALWHGIDWTLVVFGIYHGLISIGHRYVVERQRKLGRPAPVETWYSHAIKSFLVIVYVSLSIPLLVLDWREAIAFYGHLFFGFAV